MCVLRRFNCVWLLCNPLGCRLPGSSFHGIFPARILEEAAIRSSRGSCRPRGWTEDSSPLAPPEIKWSHISTCQVLPPNEFCVKLMRKLNIHILSFRTADKALWIYTMSCRIHWFPRLKNLVSCLLLHGYMTIQQHHCHYNGQLRAVC